MIESVNMVRSQLWLHLKQNANKGTALFLNHLKVTPSQMNALVAKNCDRLELCKVTTSSYQEAGERVQYRYIDVKTKKLANS